MGHTGQDAFAPGKWPFQNNAAGLDVKSPDLFLVGTAPHFHNGNGSLDGAVNLNILH
jgi:hypothetical protein